MILSYSYSPIIEHGRNGRDKKLSKYHSNNYCRQESGFGGNQGICEIIKPQVPLTERIMTVVSASWYFFIEKWDICKVSPYKILNYKGKNSNFTEKKK